MQFDQTSIAIRERRFADILDLSLRVFLSQARAILASGSIMIFPFMVLNWLLIGWMTGEGEPEWANARYIWVMAQLVFVEAPIGTVLTTLLIGRTMFMQKLRLIDTLRDLRRLSWRLLWCQLVIRGVIPAIILVSTIVPDDNATSAEVFLPILCCYLAALRAFRPYINEIILLERNPLRSSARTTVTIARRSATLHGPDPGNLLGRWLASAIVGIWMTTAFVFSFLSAQGILLSIWTWNPIVLYLVVPLCMWVVALFLTVVRFLSYLDLRIRREGWEVELAVRAAARRLEAQIT